MRKPYVEMTAGGDIYRLVLTASSACALEKKYGKSLIQLLSDITKIEVQVSFLWAALQKYHHGFNMEQTMKIYDAYMQDENGGMDNLVSLYVDVMAASGFMRRPEEAEETSGKVISMPVAAAEAISEVPEETIPETPEL